MKHLLALLLLSSLIVTSALASNDRYLDGQFITNGAATLTLPTSSDTLVGKETADVLENKTLDGVSNTFSNIPTSAIAGSALSGTNSGDVTIGTANGLSLAGQVLSLQLASGSQPGALSASDFTLFSGKLSSTLTDGYIFVGNGSNVATGVALSGDATISNAGVLTIGAKKIQASKLDSGAASAGYVATADGSGGVSYSAPVSVAPAISGTNASPTAVVGANGILFSGSAYDNLHFLEGSGGPVTISANPKIEAGTLVGQKLKLITKSATNTITMTDGNGVSLNGTFVGGLDSAIDLVWTGAVWLESSRR